MDSNPSGPHGYLQCPSSPSSTFPSPPCCPPPHQPVPTTFPVQPHSIGGQKLLSLQHASPAERKAQHISEAARGGKRLSGTTYVRLSPPCPQRCVLREAPGVPCWTFSPRNPPYTLFLPHHSSLRSPARAASVWKPTGILPSAVYFPTTSPPHRVRWRLRDEVTLPAPAPFVPGSQQLRGGCSSLWLPSLFSPPSRRVPFCLSPRL